MTTPDPPTLSFLYKPGSKQLVLDPAAPAGLVSTIGDVSFYPDTGQFWLPTLVHVSTRSNSQVKAELHVGSIAALDDNTTVKDLTFTGSNDTSTILSGTVISPGEGIRVKFSGGTTTDLAFVEVIGLSSSIPPTKGIIPQIPGARFSGNRGGGFQSPTIQNGTVFGMAGGGFFGALLDFRGYSSFDMAIDINTTNNATARNPVSIILQWGDAPNVSKILFEQHYEINAGDKNNVFGTNGRFELQDAVHGQFCNVIIESNGPDTLNGAFSASGTLFNLTRPYVRNTQGSPSSPLNGGALNQDHTQFFATNPSVAAGGTDTLFVPMMIGQATLWLNAVANFIVSLWSPDHVDLFFQTGPTPAAGNTTVAITMPSKAVIMEIKNNGGVANGYIVAITVNVRSVGG